LHALAVLLTGELADVGRRVALDADARSRIGSLMLRTTTASTASSAEELAQVKALRECLT
jgi:hypothetical protein